MVQFLTLRTGLRRISLELSGSSSHRDSNRKLGTNAGLQLLDDGTLHLWGRKTVTYKILELN
jgi:hypothetical protein